MQVRVHRGGGLSRLAVAPVPIAGAIEIGRRPGVVQVTFRAPAERLEAGGVLSYPREQSPAR